MLASHEADAAADAAARQHAANLQRRAGKWYVLMYSPYWRRLIAIYAGHCDQGIVLQAAKPEELWQLMDRVAPADWQMAALPLLAPPRVAAAAVDAQQSLPAAFSGHGE